MTARRLILPAAFAVLLGFAGCAPPEEQPKAERAKTAAELIVGRWRLVKRTPPNSRGSKMTFEYTRDGTVTLWKGNWHDKVGQFVETGTYRIEGNTLFLTMDSDPTDRQVTIESITEDKMITSGFSGSTKVVYEDERIRGDVARR